jgi:hypothetical protein
MDYRFTADNYQFNADSDINISAFRKYEEAFRGACENGHLELAQSLYETKPTIDISAENEWVFRWACLKGHLDVAQWLYKIKPTIDISAKNEWAFGWACGNGYLDVAQWLYTIKPTIDISAKNEEAFREACENGHLELAQWLYKIKPTIDISAKNEEAFREACENGHLELAQWLQTLMPYGLYYTFEVDKQNKITSYSTEKLNYSFLKKRLDTVHSGNEICFREALVRNRFHPKYMDKWVDWGHEEAEDFDMML